MIFAKIPSDNLNNRPLQSRKTPILKNTVFSIKPSRVMNKIYKTNGIFLIDVSNTSGLMLLTEI